MKILNLKPFLIATILIVSIFSMPIMALGQETREEEDYEKSDEYGAFDNFHGGFGNIFSDNMGYGGELLGILFEMLLLDGVDLEEKETLESTYVLSASIEEVYEGNYSFS